MVDEILDLYQGFLSTWGHMLSFSVTGGTEKIVGFWFAWGGAQYPDRYYIDITLSFEKH